MIANNIAYIDPNGKPVERVQGYRNRNINDQIKIEDVILDAEGKVHHRPIPKLACFGNPIEHERGALDPPRMYKGKINGANWCNGCHSRPACGTIALARIASNDNLSDKHEAWLSKTQHLTGGARFAHESFTDFAVASNDCNWTSSNDDALSRKREEAAKQKRKARAAQRKKAKRSKGLSAAAFAELQDERDQRLAALTRAARAPGAPKKLRLLPDASIELTCDVWQARTAIERKHRGEISGNDIAMALRALGKDYGIADQSLRIRVNEAVRRIALLEDRSVETPVWGGFDDDAQVYLPRSPGQISNGVVWQILEDA